MTSTFLLRIKCIFCSFFLPFFLPSASFFWIARIISVHMIISLQNVHAVISLLPISHFPMITIVSPLADQSKRNKGILSIFPRYFDENLNIAMKHKNEMYTFIHSCKRISSVSESGWLDLSWLVRWIVPTARIEKRECPCVERAIWN